MSGDGAVRVLYAVTRAEFGGAQSHVAQLLTAASSRGWQVLLTIGEVGPLTSYAEELGVPVLMIPDLIRAVSPVQDLRALASLRTAMRRFGPNLVHAHSSKAGALGRLAATLEGVPSVFTAHGWAFSEGAPPIRRALALASETAAGKWSRRVITVSDYDLDLARRHRIVPESRLVRIHNGVPDTPCRALNVEAEPPIVMMVARFSAPKRQTDLLRAACDLSREFRLVFVGEGEGKEAAERAALSLGLADRVEMLGGSAEVPRLLAGAQVFALISDWEGLPLSVLEAMRAGLPVVASDVGGISEAVTDGETGFLVPRGDVDALRSRLDLLISDPDLRKRMGTAGRRRYEALFRAELMLRQTWEVYQQVLEESDCWSVSLKRGR